MDFHAVCLFLFSHTIRFGQVKCSVFKTGHKERAIYNGNELFNMLKIFTVITLV